MFALWCPPLNRDIPAVHPCLSSIVYNTLISSISIVWRSREPTGQLIRFDKLNQCSKTRTISFIPRTTQTREGKRLEWFHSSIDSPIKTTPQNVEAWLTLTLLFIAIVNESKSWLTYKYAYSTCWGGKQILKRKYNNLLIYSHSREQAGVYWQFIFRYSAINSQVSPKGMCV